MKMHASNVRIIALAVAVLAFGSWHLFGLASDPPASAPDPLPAGPVLQPELIGARDSPPDLRSGARLAAGHQDVRDGNGTAGGSVAWSPDPGAVHAAASGRPSSGDRELLDSVFAPDRFVPEPAVGASAVSVGLEPGVAAPAVTGAGQAWLPTSAPRPATGAGGAADAQKAQPRQGTEKAYYEDFLVLARDDTKEMGRQAAIVLAEGGENARKVALLRALYATDRGQALDYFVKAIATLPDVSRPEGVSVPTFAVDFLGKQANDPAAKALAERIAWNGYLNVSQDLRNAAARSLLAQATEADLQRYATYSGYHPPLEMAHE